MSKWSKCEKAHTHMKKHWQRHQKHLFILHSTYYRHWSQSKEVTKERSLSDLDTHTELWQKQPAQPQTQEWPSAGGHGPSPASPSYSSRSNLRTNRALRKSTKSLCCFQQSTWSCLCHFTSRFYSTEIMFSLPGGRISEIHPTDEREQCDDRWGKIRSANKTWRGDF